MSFLLVRVCVRGGSEGDGFCCVIRRLEVRWWWLVLWRREGCVWGWWWFLCCCVDCIDSESVRLRFEFLSEFRVSQSFLF